MSTFSKCAKTFANNKNFYPIRMNKVYVPEIVEKAISPVNRLTEEVSMTYRLTKAYLECNGN